MRKHVYFYIEEILKSEGDGNVYHFLPCILWYQSMKECNNQIRDPIFIVILNLLKPKHRRTNIIRFVLVPLAVTPLLADVAAVLYCSHPNPKLPATPFVGASQKSFHLRCNSATILKGLGPS